MGASTNTLRTAALFLAYSTSESCTLRHQFGVVALTLASSLCLFLPGACVELQWNTFLFYSTSHWRTEEGLYQQPLSGGICSKSVKSSSFNVGFLDLP